MKELVDKALAIAREVHKGQVDKAGAEYIGHLTRVAARCATDDERTVALLHDTVEDTWITPEYLLDQGFPQYIVEAVLAVTRREGESYPGFVARAALNPIGRQVKMHDLEDNMDLSRLPSPTEKDFSRLAKYQEAYRYLKSLQ